MKSAKSSRTTGLDLAESDPAQSADEQLLRRVTDAAMACVMRDGFARTTLESIVRESGVARTTIYRNIGGRDQILAAMLTAMARPHNERLLQVACGSGSWEERVLRVIATAVASMDNFPWLKELVRQGLPETSIDIFASVSLSVGGHVLRGMVESQRAAQGWRESPSVEELMRWILRQILYLGGSTNSTPQQVENYIRNFILPVFRALGPVTAPPHDHGLDQRLERIERSLARQERLLAALEPRPA